jgi:hypothetical protein
VRESVSDDIPTSIVMPSLLCKLMRPDLAGVSAVMLSGYSVAVSAESGSECGVMVERCSKCAGQRQCLLLAKEVVMLVVEV